MSTAQFWVNSTGSGSLAGREGGSYGGGYPESNPDSAYAVDPMFSEIEEVFQLPGPVYVDTENFFEDDFQAELDMEMYINDTNRVVVHSQQGINRRKNNTNPDRFAGIREELWPDLSLVDPNEKPIFNFNPSSELAIADGRQALALESAFFGMADRDEANEYRQGESYFPPNTCPDFYGFNTCNVAERQQCLNHSNAHSSNPQWGARAQPADLRMASQQ
jgi:hypothetical protein